jgi:hypothetical protein
MTSIVQLDVISQINDRSVTEEIRLALKQWIEHSKSDPKVLECRDGACEDRARGRNQAQRDLEIAEKSGDFSGPPDCQLTHGRIQSDG